MRTTLRAALMPVATVLTVAGALLGTLTSYTMLAMYLLVVAGAAWAWSVAWGAVRVMAAASRPVIPPCAHRDAVPVDLYTGELVAWLCPACDKQLPPAAFQGIAVSPDGTITRADYPDPWPEQYWGRSLCFCGCHYGHGEYWGWPERDTLCPEYPHETIPAVVAYA